MMDVNWAAGYAVELFLHRTGVLFLGFAFFTAIVAGINGFYVQAVVLWQQWQKRNVPSLVLLKEIKETL